MAIGEGERMPGSARGDLPLRRRRDGHRIAPRRRGGHFPGPDRVGRPPVPFSVAAGDDTTSIRDVAVKVVPPPTLKDLTVRLFSPPTPAWTRRRMAPGLTQVRAVVGTRVDVEALANKPIERAALHLGEPIARRR